MMLTYIRALPQVTFATMITVRQQSVATLPPHLQGGG